MITPCQAQSMAGGACSPTAILNQSSFEMDKEATQSIKSSLEETTPDAPAAMASTSGAHKQKAGCCQAHPCYGGNKDALGFALDSAPRMIVVMGAGVFVSTALIFLAKKAAGCATEPVVEGGAIPECHGRVYGMRPSSLVTTIQAVVSVIVALLMPIVGAIIDYTPYRKSVGLWSAVVVCVLVFFQIFISERFWFAVAIVQVFVAVVYCVHSTAAFAYLPGLTDDHDQQLRYYSSFTVVQFSAALIFLLSIIAITTVLGYASDAVVSARISQASVFVVSSVFFGVAWTTSFRSCPVERPLPEGSNLFTAGFIKLFRTAKRVYQEYPAIKWTLLGVALTECAVGAVYSISITFMTDQLSFTSAENGIAMFVLLVSSIPGSFIGTAITKKLNPVHSLQFCLFLWMANTALAAFVLKGPGQQLAAYGFAAVWGVTTGWYFPTERALYCNIIPKHQDAELMGAYLCACQVLGWLPPLVFTTLNEMGASMRAGLASLNFFFLLGFSVYFLLGDYDAAVAKGHEAVTVAVQSDSVEDEEAA